MPSVFEDIENEGERAQDTLKDFFGAYTPDAGDYTDPRLEEERARYAAAIAAAQGRQAPGAAGATIDQSQQAQFRGDQAGLIAQLQAQAAGQGPSLAGQQLQAGADRNLANAAALQASQRGVNPALAARSLQQQRAEITGGLAGQAAMARSAEQMQAREQLAGVLSGARGQDIGLATGQAGLTQEAQLANQQAGLQQQQLNDQMVAYYEGLGFSRDMAQLQATQALSAQEQAGRYGILGMVAGVTGDVAANWSTGQTAGGFVPENPYAAASGGRVPRDRTTVQAEPGEYIVPREVAENYPFLIEEIEKRKQGLNITGGPTGSDNASLLREATDLRRRVDELERGGQPAPTPTPTPTPPPTASPAPGIGERVRGAVQKFGERQGALPQVRKFLRSSAQNVRDIAGIGRAGGGPRELSLDVNQILDETGSDKERMLTPEEQGQMQAGRKSTGDRGATDTYWSLRPPPRAEWETLSKSSNPDTAAYFRRKLEEERANPMTYEQLPPELSQPAPTPTPGDTRYQRNKGKWPWQTRETAISYGTGG